MKPRRLFIPGYYSGFTNNRMSLDIAVVLAHLTERVLVPYHFRIPRRAGERVRPGHLIEPLVLVPDLFEIPVAWSHEYLEEKRPPAADAVTCDWAPVYDSVFYPAGDALADEALFRAFRNGRPHAYTFDARESEAADLHLRTETLGFYSHFFYLDQRTRADVIQLMKRLQPKRPYRELAERIAAGLGRFNAIHVRRGDFVSTHFTPRATVVSGQGSSPISRRACLAICRSSSARTDHRKKRFSGRSSVIFARPSSSISTSKRNASRASCPSTMRSWLRC